MLKGSSVTVTIRKMTVSAASRMVRAISLGGYWTTWAERTVSVSAR